jgi:hypothetical protein
MGLTVGHRQTPAMISDNRPANRQPHAHSVGFRCKERLPSSIADRDEARRVAINIAKLPDLLQRRRVGDNA